MRPLAPTLVLAFALLALAPTASALEREITVYLHENPLHALPETINADVGDVLKISVENPEAEGKGPHNFLVCGDGKKFGETCEDRWGFTGMIQPGEVAQVTVTLAKAGTFEYYCYIPGHKGGGMTGDLVVASAGGAGKSGIPLAPFAALAGLAAAALLVRRRSG